MFRLKNLLVNNNYLPKEVEVHNWELQSKFFAPPRKNLNGIEHLDKESQEKALFGVTVYLWKDKNTGEFKKQEFLGSDLPLLEELFIKVKQFGQQHVKDDNGEIYTIQKYVNPNTNPRDLPLRSGA